MFPKGAPRWVAVAIGLPLLAYGLGNMARDFTWLGYVAAPLGVGVLGVCGVFILLEWWKSRAEAHYIRLSEGGLWLYRAGNAELRAALGRLVPEVFSSIGEHGAAMIRHAAQRGACTLYARRDVGLELESISPDEADLTAFDCAFGATKPDLRDVSVLRRDLKKVLAFYQDG